jgi:hypothetical protein
MVSLSLSLSQKKKKKKTHKKKKNYENTKTQNMRVTSKAVVYFCMVSILPLFYGLDI